MPSSENTNPPIVPAPKANQNTSFCPSFTKGIKPKIVESTVSSIGNIFCLKACI